MAYIKLPDIPRGITFISQIRKLSEESPSKQAFVFTDKYGDKTVLSRKDVWDKSRKFAAFLKRRGIKKGDIVCNTLVNSPERVVTALGTVVAGAISMHGQIFFEDGEDIIHNLSVAKCKALIIDSGHPNGALPILKRIEFTDDKTEETRYKGLPDLTTIIDFPVFHPGNDESSFKRSFVRLDEEEDMFEETDVSEDDVAFIFSASGSTGFSKQVPYSHRASLLIGRNFNYLLGIKSENCRFFQDRSLGWLGGFPGMYVLSGATRIMTDHWKGLPGNLGQHLLKLFNDEEVDSGALIPMEFEPLVKLILSGQKLNRKLPVFGTGGMPFTKKGIKPLGIISERMNITYGGTEPGYITILELESPSQFEDYCAGIPYEGYEIKIMDEDRKELPTGKVGEVAIKSGTHTFCYLNEPEKTERSTTKDGFILLGDSGFKDEKGRLFILGRKVHAIHKGVYIHYPGWIELRILKCPGIEHVTVLDVPDEANHHEICACIILEDGVKLTEQELRVYCERLFKTEKDSGMSAAPKYYLFFDAYPRNPNGKLDKGLLRKEACRRLNISID